MHAYAPPVSTPVLRVKKLHPSAAIPAYQSDQAAGLDLSACLPAGEVAIEPGCIAAVPCGLSVAIPPGHEGQVRPRSGLATRHGISMPNTPGTIDSDYRGEVIVPLINHGREAFRVTHGMRIAQMVIAPVTRVEIETVDSLDSTRRGAGGFGSTGIA